ncbi:hypothetical protein J4460_04975 [Candidatus Woesearchaeota archaeon]|nr:hypothetical protein [Candidatus Woesearchaeota archaeon]HIH38040.1 hypothetical protein [Candidatus Woesearchaeota archaeon]HIH48559.1 hypothetical protein [Candidatus Woesearchaeota archaeon]HIJ04260.1 hypothetical protein [Candidatus Woesearchaeota archaeon]
MQVRIKKTNEDGIVRLETSGAIREVLITEDLAAPNGEKISLCFRGENSSGIIDLSPQEVDKLVETVSSRMKLIKGMKKIRV